MRSAELDTVVQWVNPGSRVLDLGCGDGALLARLQAEKGVTGYGLDIDLGNIRRSVQAGINVIQADLDDGLDHFETASFDTVLLMQTLQAVRTPARVLGEMLRVGREGVVTFPNFAHWRARAQLVFGAKMPVTRALPSQWFETQNIHLCTLDDFELLCARTGVEIVERVVRAEASTPDSLARTWPTLFGATALYRVRSASGG